MTDQIEVKKVITELKVSELKVELEKRGLDKNGVKAALIERLEKAVKDEGHDIATHVFSLVDANATNNSTSTANAEVAATLTQPATTVAPSSIQIATNGEEGIGNNNDAIRRACTVNQETKVQKENETIRCEESTDGVSRVEEVCDVTPEAQASVVCSEQIEVDTRDTATSVSDSMDAVADKPTHNEGSSGKAAALNVQVNSSAANISADCTSNVEATTIALPATVHRAESNVSSTSPTRNVDTPKSTADDLSTKTKSDTSTIVVSNKIVQKPADQAILASSVWIRGISSTTKAADLKALFSKFGKVVAAKIFTTKNKLSPTCFGYITMTNAEAAELCIQKLNRTNLKGKVITVEKTNRSLLPQINKAGRVSTLATTTGGSSNNQTSTVVSTTAAVNNSADLNPVSAAAASNAEVNKKSGSMSKDTSPEVIYEDVRDGPFFSKTTAASGQKPSITTTTSSKSADGGSSKTTTRPRIVVTTKSKKIEPPSSSTRQNSQATKRSTVTTSTVPRSFPIQRNITRRLIATARASGYQQRFGSSGDAATTAGARFSSSRISAAPTTNYRGGFRYVGGSAIRSARFVRTTNGATAIGTTAAFARYRNSSIRRPMSSSSRIISSSSSSYVHHQMHPSRHARPDVSPERRASLSSSRGGGIVSAARDKYAPVAQKMTNWEREEMIRLMRRREEEHRKKEQELKLEREKERVKFERERLERERLEIQQMKLTAQLANAQMAFLPQAGMPASNSVIDLSAIQHDLSGGGVGQMMDMGRTLQKDQYERGSSHRHHGSSSRATGAGGGGQHKSSSTTKHSSSMSKTREERSSSSKRHHSSSGGINGGGSGVSSSRREHDRESRSKSRVSNGHDRAAGSRSRSHSRSVHKSHYSQHASRGNSGRGGSTGSSGYHRYETSTNHQQHYADRGRGRRDSSSGRGYSSSSRGGGSSSYRGNKSSGYSGGYGQTTAVSDYRSPSTRYGTDAHSMTTSGNGGYGGTRDRSPIRRENDSGRDSYVNSSRRLYEPRTDPNYATRVGLGDSRAGGMAGISADEMFGSTNSGGLPLNYTGTGGRSDTYSGSAGRNYRDLPLSYQATSSGATDSWATSGSSFIGSSRAYGDAGASTNSWSTAGGGALASGVHMLWNGSGRGSGIEWDSFAAPLAAATHLGSGGGNASGGGSRYSDGYDTSNKYSRRY